MPSDRGASVLEALPEVPVRRLDLVPAAAPLKPPPGKRLDFQERFGGAAGQLHRLPY